MQLHRPRYLALDSSHLSQWVHDKTSPSASGRSAAANFEAWAEDNGFVLLLTLHHLEELLNHNDEAKALKRLDCLARLKMVSWIGDQDAGPGGITTIARAEARYILATPETDAPGVRDAVLPSLIRFGTGSDLLGQNPREWLALRPLMQDRANSTRELVALAHTDVVDISSQPISELMSGRLRNGDELGRALTLLEGSYAVDIQLRGDKRIVDPASLASSFVAQVKEMAEGLPGTTADFVLQGLALQGVVPEDIKPKSTVGEMLDLGLFRSQLKVLLEDYGVTPEAVRKIQMAQMPSWQVQQAMRRFTPQPRERDGSEVNDAYLACLAPYADVTSVDKRVHLGFSQAIAKVPAVAALVRRVERASRYDRIPALLA